TPQVVTRLAMTHVNRHAVDLSAPVERQVFQERLAFERHSVAPLVMVAAHRWNVAFADGLNDALRLRPAPDQIARTQNVVYTVKLVQPCNDRLQRRIVAVYVRYDSNLHPVVPGRDRMVYIIPAEP